VIGGTAMQFHFPERVPGDLDVVVARTEDAGRRLLVALPALGHRVFFTPEEYAHGPGLSGFPFKPPRSSFNTDMLRAEPWFEFDKRWNEAHDTLLFETPVKVATKDAIIVWIEHAQDPEPKHLRDLELLRRLLP
jgi:hypothetical protein